MLDGNPQCGVEVNCGSTLLENITFIFDPVWWNYPYKVFDNSIGTWATDYALAVFMVNHDVLHRFERQSRNHASFAAFRNRTTSVCM